MTEREQFLLKRRIGGSTCAQILGHSKYGGPADAYDEVVAAIEGNIIDPEPTVDQERGRILEPVAAQMYIERTGRTVRRQPQRAHPDYPFLTCNIDRQILVPSNGDEPLLPLPEASTGVCELKVPRSMKARKIADMGLDDAWVLQLQHNLAVTGYTWGSYGIMNPDEPTKIGVFDIKRDDEWVNGVWLPAMLAFWRDHIEPRIRPKEEESVPAQLPDAPAGELVVLEDPKWVEAVDKLSEAYQMAREISDIKGARVERVQALMEDAEVSLVECSGVRIYWRPQAGRKMLDKNKVVRYIADTGGDPEEFYTTTKAFRPFKGYRVDTGEPL